MENVQPLLGELLQQGSRYNHPVFWKGGNRMENIHQLLGELLQQGSRFAHDKWVIGRAMKDLCSHVSACKVCLDANQFTKGELYSVSRDIYGLAKTVEKKNPSFAHRHREFYRVLDQVSRHVYRETGYFACRIDGEAVGVLFV